MTSVDNTNRAFPLFIPYVFKVKVFSTNKNLLVIFMERDTSWFIKFNHRPVGSSCQNQERPKPKVIVTHRQTKEKLTIMIKCGYLDIHCLNIREIWETLPLYFYVPILYRDYG